MRTVHHIPGAWDWHFSRQRPSWVVVRLKDGSRVFGLFHNRSFAASDPEQRDIYLEAQFRVLDGGEWAPVEDTDGVLIKSEEIALIEFRKVFGVEYDGSQKTRDAQQARYRGLSTRRLGLSARIPAERPRSRRPHKAQATQRRHGRVATGAPGAVDSQGRERFEISPRRAAAHRRHRFPDRQNRLRAVRPLGRRNPPRRRIDRQVGAVGSRSVVAPTGCRNRKCVISATPPARSERRRERANPHGTNKVFKNYY